MMVKANSSRMNKIIKIKNKKPSNHPKAKTVRNVNLDPNKIPPETQPNNNLYVPNLMDNNSNRKGKDLPDLMPKRNCWRSSRILPISIRLLRHWG